MREDDAQYYRQDWMTDDQWECAQMIADICKGWHHVTGKVMKWGGGIKYSCHASRLATFDYEGLTRAVIMAHDRCIRLELAASSPGRIGLCLWKRHTRYGARIDRHPTIHEAVVQWHDPDYADPDNGHIWIEKFNMMCCAQCGMVRRDDGENSPCRGAVSIELRESSHG